MGPKAGLDEQKISPHQDSIPGHTLYYRLNTQQFLQPQLVPHRYHTLYEMTIAHLNALCYMLDACASSASVHASQRTHMVIMATILMSPSACLTENTVTMVTMAMKCQSVTHIKHGS